MEEDIEIPIRRREIALFWLLMFLLLPVFMLLYLWDEFIRLFKKDKVDG